MHHSSQKYWQVNRNAIPQDLTKPKDVTSPHPTMDSRLFGTNCVSNSSYESNETLAWLTNDFGMPQQFNNDVYHSQKHYGTPTSPHTDVNQQPPSQNPFDFNQSVVELFRCQTKLIHSSQWPHQKTTDVFGIYG